jgi:hypothetical protein
MEEVLAQYGRLVGEIGLAGFAILAVKHLWNRLLEQSDIHRRDSLAQGEVHRAELGKIEERHANQMAELNREHRAETQGLVIRNMDEHRERNRVIVMLVQGNTDALTRLGEKLPELYPRIDINGRKKES